MVCPCHNYEPDNSCDPEDRTCDRWWCNDEVCHGNCNDEEPPCTCVPLAEPSITCTPVEPSEEPNDEIVARVLRDLIAKDEEKGADPRVKDILLKALDNFIMALVYRSLTAESAPEKKDDPMD